MHLSDENWKALLISANQSIEEHASGYAEYLLKGQLQAPAYPPNGRFKVEEAEALKQLQGNIALHPAMRKLLAGCAANVLFDLFNLIDGTTDPGYMAWSGEGVILVDKPENDDKHREHLHDEFFDAYWNWRDIRPDKTWQLDLLPE
ncbi:MAG TPA: hypothetical protein VF690_05565 [Hymenobacter sp.]|jgi:hypothetical protein